MEIWTIKEDWSTLKKHRSFKEADGYTHPEAFQTLYRKGPEYPVHLYKSHK